jgi:hypothetical protein
MRPPKDYFFDFAEDSVGEYVTCPEGGERLVVEDGGDGRMLAFCYRHAIACLVGKGWDKEKMRRGV